SSEVVGRPLRGIAVEVEQRDPVALLREALRDREPHAGCGARDHCDATHRPSMWAGPTSMDDAHRVCKAGSRIARMALPLECRRLREGRGHVRIGLMIGPERGRYRDKVAKLVADAEAAEAAGFTSIWVPQIPNDFDALTAVALMGRATSRVELGTAGGA